jgi:mxaL protein
MVEEGAPAAAAPVLGATPGSEHLSSLREGYLKLLAGENGFTYRRLSSASALAAALQAPAFERPLDVQADLRPALAMAALLLLLWPYALTLGRVAKRGSAAD